ncbi:hypothetical protein CRE_03831 [Caenorhabditis remanei]|uniref:Uncharacterized protein n=1 Tax=Caenorhabditis remanei TaxID=31234 RepID=E3LXC2_CAERE|nr:hypothetical protein CRE_03831 [Caenorhabditis remanei]
MEVRRMLEDTNQRHAQIERMTKEAAIRHNQMNPDGQILSGRDNGGTNPSVPIQPPIPAPIPPPPLPTEQPQQVIIRTAPPPTIEDDRTFLAKMSEQEALVNQLNSIATREAVARNGLLVMEGALLNALRPITMPFLGGQPIPGHFVPFQRMQRPIEQSPVDNNIEVQARPPAQQLPMRAKNLETYEFQMDDELAEMIIRNETRQAN